MQKIYFVWVVMFVLIISSCNKYTVCSCNYLVYDAGYVKPVNSQFSLPNKTAAEAISACDQYDSTITKTLGKSAKVNCFIVN